MKEVVYKAAEMVDKIYEQRVIKAVRDKKTQIRFSRNKIDIAISYDEISYYAFLAKKSNGGRKTVEFTAPTEEELLQKIELASKLVEKLPPNPEFVSIADKKYSYPSPRYDEKFLTMDAKGAVEQAIDAAIRAGAKRVAGTLYIYDYEVFLKTPYNEGHDRNVYADLSVRAFIEKTITGHRVNSASKYADFDPENTGYKAGEFAKLGAMNRVKVDAGKYDTIFGPLAFANFISYAGWGASISAVEHGFSPLRVELLGKQLGSEKFTLISSARTDYVGYKLFDDEGVPVKEVKIFDKGIFKSHLHSTSTAKRHNTESTGNAGILDPRPRQLIVEAGDSSFEEMVSETKRGIFVSNVRYTRFQSYVTGDFSTIPRDAMLYIENGEIKGSLRGLRVNGNALQRLQNIEMLSRDTYPIHRREVEIPVVVPYALIKNVTFTEAH